MDSALKTPAIGLHGPTPLLRLQSDERLVVLSRRGNQAAFEALVGRYQSRLLGFTRHMLGSKEDAEDVLQEVFAAAYNAMLADDRPINVRPWLYRIARNRSLNHLRKQQPIGVDSMDIHFADGGISTADRVHKREDFRHLLEDVGELPETQRTALLLREIDALSYEQIAEAMETTVPSVKSLLVRARVSLAEAAEARRLTCEEVRDELGEVAEGIKRMSPPVRRHVRSCETCAGFRKQLHRNNKAMAAILPIAPFLMFKKTILAHLGLTTGAGAAGTAVMGSAAVTSTGAMSAGFGALASKTAAGIAAAAVVTAGAVEVDRVQQRSTPSAPPVTAVAPPAPEPVVVASRPQPVASPAIDEDADDDLGADATIIANAAATPREPEPVIPGPPAATDVPALPSALPPAAPPAPLAPAEQGADAVTLPPDDAVTTVPGGAGAPPTSTMPPPVPEPVPAPPAPPVPTVPETPPVEVPPAAEAPPVDVPVVETPPVDVPAVDAAEDTPADAAP